MLQWLQFTKYLQVDCDYKILALTNATYLRNIPASSSSLTQEKNYRSLAETARFLNLKDILLWRKVLVSAQLNEYMQLRKAYMSGTQGDTNEIQEKAK